MMNRVLSGALAGLGPASAAALGSPAEAAYPVRPITVIVPWSAGGGTDATGRIIAKIMQDELGVPVNVVNRTGGSGVVGHQAIATAKPDGYTIGIVTVEIAMMHWVGLTDLTYKEFTPIALYNADPAGVSFHIDTKYKNVGEFLAAAKANPGKFKGSGTGQGGIWHLALAGMLVEAGIDPNAVPWVPSQGAAPALTDLAAGGIEVVTASVVEARSLKDAGKTKVMAVMNDTRLPAFPDVLFDEADDILAPAVGDQPRLDRGAAGRQPVEHPTPFFQRCNGQRIGNWSNQRDLLKQQHGERRQGQADGQLSPYRGLPDRQTIGLRKQNGHSDEGQPETWGQDSRWVQD